MKKERKKKTWDICQTPKHTVWKEMIFYGDFVLVLYIIFNIFVGFFSDNILF